MLYKVSIKLFRYKLSPENGRIWI